MEKDFLPYELAFKLVYDLGFKEKCLATIDQINYLHIKGTKSSPRGAMLYDIVDCPTFQQAFRWFREKYRLSVLIHDCLDDYIGEIVEWTIAEDKVIHEVSNRIDTYEEAELACLEKLIEIVEQKQK